MGEGDTGVCDEARVGGGAGVHETKQRNKPAAKQLSEEEKQPTAKISAKKMYAHTSSPSPL